MGVSQNMSKYGNIAPYVAGCTCLYMCIYVCKLLLVLYAMVTTPNPCYHLCVVVFPSRAPSPRSPPLPSLLPSLIPAASLVIDVSSRLSGGGSRHPGRRHLGCQLPLPPSACVCVCVCVLRGLYVNGTCCGLTG